MTINIYIYIYIYIYKNNSHTHISFSLKSLTVSLLKHSSICLLVFYSTSSSTHPTFPGQTHIIHMHFLLHSNTTHLLHAINTHTCLHTYTYINQQHLTPTHTLSLSFILTDLLPRIGQKLLDAALK
jgi:hypothetical protein